MTNVQNAPLIVIPDTHGHRAHVEALVSHCQTHGLLTDHKFLFLGDYFDRGPEVRGLIERCIALQHEGHIFLMGNHEYTLMRALDNSSVRAAWIRRWAERYEDRTLISYGLSAPKVNDVAGWKRVADDFRAAMPSTHWEFFSSLPFVYETDDCIFVHAGLLPDVSWETQRTALRNRDEGDAIRGPSQLFSEALGYAEEHLAPKVVVSGHSVVKVPKQTARRRMLHCGVDVGGPLVAWVTDAGKYLVAS